MLLRRSVPLLQTGAALRRPLRLSDEEVRQFRRDGYVVLPPGTLDGGDVARVADLSRAIATQRGDKFVPASDTQHRPDNFELKATLKQAVPPDQRHLVSPGGSVNPTFERKEKRIKMTFRSKKQMQLAYSKLVELRQRYGRYKGVHSSPASKGNELPSDGGGDSSGFEPHPDDDIDVSGFGRAEAQRSFDEYKASGKMERDVRSGSHLNDALMHIYNGPRTWSFVAASDPNFRLAVLGSRIGSDLGSVGAQLSGSMTTRLYNDTIVLRPPFCNPAPYHHDACSLNYRDPRGLHATIVLPGSAQPLDDYHGGYVVLPGSHRCVENITNNCRDMTAFVRPSAWDLGECIRPFPELMALTPVSLGRLHPGTVVLFSNQLVYTINSNFAPDASPTARTHLLTCRHTSAADPAADAGAGNHSLFPPAATTSLFLHEAPLTYSLSIMPDGVVFDGCRNSWMSRDSHGPLHALQAGAPLRDQQAFPVLFSEVEVSA